MEPMKANQSLIRRMREATSDKAPLNEAPLAGGFVIPDVRAGHYLYGIGGCTKQ